MAVHAGSTIHGTGVCPIAEETIVNMSAIQKIPVNEKIRARREELKLSDIDLARSTRLSIYEYGDVEQHSDEIHLVVPLYHVKKICEVLRLPFLELFGFPCAFCGEGVPHHDDYWLSRSSLVERRRKALGISIDELGDRAGFKGLEMRNVETYTAHLESWAIDNILELSAALQIPGQVLLDIRCPRCGR